MSLIASARSALDQKSKYADEPEDNAEEGVPNETDLIEMSEAVALCESELKDP